MKWFPAERSTLYALLAYASVVLTTFVQLTFNDRLVGEPWQVVVTFVLGGLMIVLATFCDWLTENRAPWRKPAYFIAQTVIVAAAIAFSPSRGFFAILAMPVISHAIFELPWRGSLAVGLTLFSVSVGIWAGPFGFAGVVRAFVSYLSGYLFTIVFSILAREAFAARKKSEQLASELAAANALLRAQAAQTAELATTRERNRLAREIHDGVGHYLTVIKTQLDAATALLPTDSARAADSVTKAARLAGEALDDVRRSVGTLAADAVRPPLVDTIRQLAHDCDGAATLQIEGEPRPLPAAAEHALFRTAQEGLTNLRKHAAARTATITLDFRDAHRVRLSLVDDGRGASAAASPDSGFGLRGLRERFALLGGRVVAENRPDGRGFALTAEVPA